MKKTVKLLTLLLVAIMLVSCFTACNNNKQPATTNPSGGNSTTTTPEEVDYELPEKVDLGGYVYKAYVRSNAQTGGTTREDGNPAFYCEDFWVDTAPGTEAPKDALTFAVYTRNKEIENDYKVSIRQVNNTINMVQELNRYYQDGERFDLTIILAKSAATAATQNLLTDLKSLPSLDLNHEAYDQNSIKELSMANKLYYLSGDMNISTLDSVAPTIVNLQRYEDYAEEIVDHFGDSLYSDVYNLVTEGKWTMDTMLQISEIASLDAETSDGNLGASTEDEIGYFQYYESAVYYFYGAGGRLTQMNDSGSPEFVIQNDKNGNLFDYLFENFHPVKRNVKYPCGDSKLRKENFITNANTLFTDMTLWDVRKDLYVNSTFEYGLLPNPVKDEGDKYNAVVYFYNTVHLWAIPSLCNNYSNAQLMMNVMAAYSNLKKEGSTMDGYYTRTLYLTVAGYNPGARKVMDIIKDSTVYDIALLYDWGGWAKELSELWTKRTDNNHGILVPQMNSANGAYKQLEETLMLFENPGMALD